MKTRRLRLLAMVALTGLTVTACAADGGQTDGNGQGDTGVGTEGTAEESPTSDDADGETGDDSVAGGDSESITVQIEGGAVPYYAPWFVAEQRGYFAEEGLEVEFSYSGGADIARNVGAGNVDFGFPNGDSVVVARSEGIPITVAHTSYQEGIGATLYKEDSGISSPADLQDRTVAVTSYGSPNFVQLQVMLEDAGLSLRDVNIEIVGTGSIVEALVQDEVDAIVFSAIRWWQLDERGVDVGMFRSDEFLPSHGNVLIVNDDYLNQNSERVAAVTRALNQGLEWTIENPGEAIDLAIEEYAPDWEDDRDSVLRVFNELFIPDLWQSDVTEAEGLGAADLDRWQTTIDLLREHGLVSEELDASEFVLESPPS